MKEIEWCDSGDTSEEQCKAAIMACINEADVMDSLVEEAKKLIEEVNSFIQEWEDGEI